MAIGVGFLMRKRLLEFLLARPVARLRNVDAFILEGESAFFDGVTAVWNEL